MRTTALKRRDFSRALRGPAGPPFHGGPCGGGAGGEKQIPRRLCRLRNDKRKQEPSSLAYAALKRRSSTMVYAAVELAGKNRFLGSFAACGMTRANRNLLPLLHAALKGRSSTVVYAAVELAGKSRFLGGFAACGMTSANRNLLPLLTRPSSAALPRWSTRQ